VERDLFGSDVEGSEKSGVQRLGDAGLTTPEEFSRNWVLVVVVRP